MPDCCGQGSARYEDVFDGDFAHDVAERYRRRGLTAPERRIVEHLAAQDLSDRTVLEIGGGVGVLQLELLARGAGRTTNLELSGAYEAEAQSLLDERGRRADATRVVGVDLASQGDRIPAADYVVLHRVVCCYPDSELLLEAAAAHTRRVLVFSHPPRTWFSRLFAAFENATMRMRGREYRAYIHRPGAMYAALEHVGLQVTPLRKGVRWWIVGATRT